MRFVKLLAIVFFIALIVNCAKKEEVKTFEQYEENGIKITKNNGTPADTTFSIELKEVGFIDMENEEDSLKMISRPISFDFDKEGNMYLLDYQKCTVHKYNNQFEHISVFGGKGQGPGEFVQARKLLVVGDTLLVTDTRQWKINKLDLNGKFIVDKKYSDFEKALVDLAKFGSGYINKFYGSTTDEEGQTYSVESISFFDAKMEFVKFIYENKELFNRDKVQDPSAKGSVHVTNSDELFVYLNSKTDYKINVYDKAGKKKRVIRKNYARIKNSEEMIKKQEENSKKYGLKFRTEFLNSIYTMYTDKYGRLWVSSSVKKEEKGAHYDIFKDDVFLKRVNIEMEEGYLPVYIGEKIICQNWKDNSLKVYDY